MTSINDNRETSVMKPIRYFTIRVLPYSFVLFLLISSVSFLKAADTDELKVKRNGPFEFAEKPSAEQDGDRVTIRFVVRSFCDVTVAIENKEGRIIRHLACGVLGENAPKPFTPGSLTQEIIWDGKDDQGRYVDDKAAVNIRISLGLKPRLERTLFWSSHKRYGKLPLMAAAPEGVYVFDGKGVDFVRLFDHNGDYLRCVYPFPSDKLNKVQGLSWHDFPQGYRLPRKGGLYQTTFLTSGTNWHTGNHGAARKTNAASAIAVRDKRLTLADVELCRLNTDGSSGKLSLKGAKVCHDVGGLFVGPASIAFSPDAKTIYTTGYLWQIGSWNRKPGCLHAVYKVDYEKGSTREIFKGHAKKHGTDNEHFSVPTSVACDNKGNVYVSDLVNDRIQIYSPDGRFLKSIPCNQPVKVCVHQKSGEVWVFSYPLFGIPRNLQKSKYKYSANIKPVLARYSAYPACKEVSREPFPVGPGENMGFKVCGNVYYVELDSWADEPTVWVAGRRHSPTAEEFRFSPGYQKNQLSNKMWTTGVRLFRKVEGKWKPIRSFGQDTVKKIVRARPARHNVQRLIVHPLTGMLYVAEPDSGPTGKASKQWLEINPETGAVKTLELPFNAMEGVFDINGYLYLRNTDYIVRYTFPKFREVTWDYGQEKQGLGNDGSIYGRSTNVMSALKMPSVSPVCYHQGGINVNLNGDVVASCAFKFEGISSGHLKGRAGKHRQVYQPKIYPGRVISSIYPCIHIWDKHGKLKYEDAVPGVGQPNGVAIDKDCNVYVMHCAVRGYNRKRYFNEMTETLMKVAPKKGKVMFAGKGAPIPLSKDLRPRRDPDFMRGMGWVENAEWLYGGVGFAGFNMIGHGGGCACWFARFQMDYFNRCIAPEPHQFRIAVLDSAGNLILRIGRYGNVDDGLPLIKDGGSSVAKSIGGDEVSLFHACFVGTHTDRRIFIADYGNARILSVRLDYHATENISLKK